MNRITIIVGKITLFLLGLLKRGGSLPGYIALKMNKNILNYFKLPKIVIAVTGSSGKTSTSYLIAQGLEKNGMTVGHNRGGNNLTNGLVTLLIKSSKINGVINKDAIVFEVDERYSKELVKYLKPNYFVVTNITRDQPPRHGNYEVVYNCIRDALNKNMTLIVNGDDPLTYKLSLEHKGKKIYFGLGNNNETIPYPISNALDFIYCPKCNLKLNYDYVHFSNVGSYSCPKCDFKRPNIDYEITSFEDELVINNKYKISKNTDITYTYYNIVCAFALLSILKINNNKISKLLSDIKFANKRYDYIKYKDRDCYILSGKNENAPSYNQAINYVSKDDNNKTIIFGFEYISLRYPHQDISWLYDIDFERLRNENISNFICIGPFAYDIAVRIKLANIDEDKIKVCLNLEDLKNCLDETDGVIYGVLNLGTDEKVIKIVGEL